MAMEHAAAVFLLLLVVLMYSGGAVHAAGDTTHLNFFLHDIVAGSNPTAVQVIKGPASSGGSAATGGPIPGIAFGDTSVIDDPLTATSSPTSAPVGRAQGFYMMSSLSVPVLMVCVNLLLTSGDYNGSTLAVIGRDDITATVRELSVVGGTGKFRMATGYVLWKTSSMSGADAHIELDVYVSTSNGTASIDASAPVSPVDGGGGGGSSTGKSSSGAAAVARGGAYGWVGACVAAVLVAAAVGRGW